MHETLLKCARSLSSDQNMKKGMLIGNIKVYVSFHLRKVLTHIMFFIANHVILNQKHKMLQEVIPANT